MTFIDGGYLRYGLKRMFGHDHIDYAKLRNHIVAVVDSQGIKSELIRAYYYDGIVDPLVDEQEHRRQNKYFEKIRSKKSFEVRLGRVKQTQDSPRQKGVDILIAVDMLTKAYLEHYDVAAFLGGDDDFLDLISAVKNLAGKRVHGFYFTHNVSPDLADCFDIESKLTKDKLQPMMKMRPKLP